VCHCEGGVTFYGPKYTNEHLTSNRLEWVEAKSIEEMIATGLAVGSQPGSHKCWFHKGFHDISTGVAFGTVDPHAGQVRHKECWCRHHPPSAPPLRPPPPPPPLPPYHPSEVCTTAAGAPVEGDSGTVCHCEGGVTFYGPKYTNEHLTSNRLEWVEAKSIEEMIATGLAVGSQPGSHKCWFHKGFHDISTGVAFGTVDPHAGQVRHKECWCRHHPPSAPPFPQPPSSPSVPPPPFTPTGTYQVFTQRRTWHDALAFCWERGGVLAELRMDSEASLLRRFIPDDAGRVWIGASDALSEGAWRWTRGAPVGFSKWAHDQPNDVRGQHCAYVGHVVPQGIGSLLSRWDTKIASDLWGDADCRARYSFACQGVSAPPTPPPSPPHLGFTVFKEKLEWQQARLECERMGGQLAKISSAEENFELLALITKPTWIGLNDIFYEGEWRWASSLDRPSWEHWARGQPGPIAARRRWEFEHCVFMSAGIDKTMGASGEWHDTICRKRLEYACQNLVNPHPPRPPPLPPMVPFPPAPPPPPSPSIPPPPPPSPPAPPRHPPPCPSPPPPQYHVPPPSPTPASEPKATETSRAAPAKHHSSSSVPTYMLPLAALAGAAVTSLFFFFLFGGYGSFAARHGSVFGKPTRELLVEEQLAPTARDEEHAQMVRMAERL